MMKRRSFFLLLLFILLPSGCSTANPDKISVASTTASVVTPAPRPLSNATQVDAYLSYLAATGALTGSVLVAHEGTNVLKIATTLASMTS